MLIGPLALAFAAAFSGAALYINMVEQPARLALDDNALLSEWRPSDRRGFALLASLALISAVLGLATYFETQDLRWLIGAVIVILSRPYTFFAMVPMNNRILAVSGSDTSAARELVRVWGLLEYGQTAIGLVACAAFLSSCCGPCWRYCSFAPPKLSGVVAACPACVISRPASIWGPRGASPEACGPPPGSACGPGCAAGPSSKPAGPARTC